MLPVIHESPLFGKYSANWAQDAKHNTIYKGKSK